MCLGPNLIQKDTVTISNMPHIRMHCLLSGYKMQMQICALFQRAFAYHIWGMFIGLPRMFGISSTLGQVVPSVSQVGSRFDLRPLCREELGRQCRPAVPCGDWPGGHGSGMAQKRSETTRGSGS